jgi:hypothetical protein
MVTFLTAREILTESGIRPAAFMIAVLAVMETPAILSGLFLARRGEKREPREDGRGRRTRDPDQRLGGPAPRRVPDWPGGRRGRLRPGQTLVRYRLSRRALPVPSRHGTRRGAPNDPVEQAHASPHASGHRHAAGPRHARHLHRHVARTRRRFGGRARGPGRELVLHRRPGGNAPRTARSGSGHLSFDVARDHVSRSTYSLESPSWRRWPEPWDDDGRNRDPKSESRSSSINPSCRASSGT